MRTRWCSAWPLVLRHGRRVRQVHAMAMRHQTIDQPVPVVRRLDNDTRKLIMKWLKFPEDRRQFVGKRLWRKTRSVSSSAANTLLLECKSIAA